MVVRDMTDKKNKIWLCGILLLSITASIVLLKSPFFDITRFGDLAPDFHYNAISMSAVIGGFLFTGISILISVIDKERIKRLWDYDYLNNLYRSALVGIIANVVTIIIAFLLVFLDIQAKVEEVFIQIEITTLVVGMVFFSWSVKHLFLLVSKLKD